MPSANESTVQVENLSYVKASLNYLADATERPVNYASEPPPGVPRRSGHYIPRVLPIHDARPMLNQISLDQQGFFLSRQETSVRNFYDTKEVEAIYYFEVERLLKEVTGAQRVFIFDHVVRCASIVKRSENGAREPAKTVHNDYSAKSGPQRVRDFLPDEAEVLLKSRFAEINVWRPIIELLKDTPLAVCDARSIAPNDLLPTDLVYQHRVGETYSVTYNSSHRWFYFPDMQRNEALLIKCYDSEEDGRARFTAHTAFDDPTSPPDAAPRESIEVRALVFFAAEELEPASEASRQDGHAARLD
jgi:hypothetical protein